MISILWNSAGSSSEYLTAKFEIGVDTAENGCAKLFQKSEVPKSSFCYISHRASTNRFNRSSRGTRCGFGRYGCLGPMFELLKLVFLVLFLS